MVVKTGVDLLYDEHTALGVSPTVRPTPSATSSRACNQIQPWSRAVRAASVRLRADSFAIAEEM
jgi:hypothetical protein